MISVVANFSEWICGTKFEGQTTTALTTPLISLALPDPLPNDYAGKGSDDLSISNLFCRNVVLPNHVVGQVGVHYGTP